MARDKTIRMSLKLPLEEGGICGALRYRVSDTPLAVLICHCRNCQQRTGSAFSLSMLTFCKDFQVTSGESLSRDLPGGSGALHRQHICRECFTRTHREMLAHPWALAPGVRCFEEDPVDIEGLVAEWRERFE